ncbi:MAG: diguanylate cyclase, partial [Actinomycetota bacterium]|nr:diguanylate cyclase [Actinomycetota bacterium]
SAGVAQWDGHESGEDLIGRADHALYRAKQAGRDAIESAC